MFLRLARTHTWFPDEPSNKRQTSKLTMPNPGPVAARHATEEFFKCPRQRKVTHLTTGCLSATSPCLRKCGPRRMVFTVPSPRYRSLLFPLARDFSPYYYPAALRFPSSHILVLVLSVAEKNGSVEP